MVRKVSKNVLANRDFGYDFEDCAPGEKAAVTRKFNAQTATVSSTRRNPDNFVIAKAGKIGNGVIEKCLSVGATVEDLFVAAKIEEIDTDKFGITAVSTGTPVDLDAEIVNGETYILSPEIKSAN